MKRDEKFLFLGVISFDRCYSFMPDMSCYKNNYNTSPSPGLFDGSVGPNDACIFIQGNTVLSRYEMQCEMQYFFRDDLVDTKGLSFNLSDPGKLLY